MRTRAGRAQSPAMPANAKETVMNRKPPTRRRRVRIAAIGAAMMIAMLAVTAQGAAPAPTAATAAPLSERLDQLLQDFARAHPSFPGVALAVRTSTLDWAGAAGVS